MSDITDIKNNVLNSTVVTYDVDTANESYHLVVKANDGYLFNDDITFEYYDQNGDYSTDRLSISEDRKTAEITNNSYYPDFGEELNGTTETGGATVSYEMTVDVSNLTVTGAKDSYTQADTINVTLTPITGYIIKVVPYLSYQDDNGDFSKIDFTVIDGVATLVKPVSELTDNVTGNPLTIYGVAEQEKPVGTSKGLINIYSVTLEQLGSFAKTRFFKTQTDSDGNTTSEQIDLGIYVKGVRQVFYPVKTSGTPNIVCGNYDTGVKVLNVDESIVNVDFGGVDIPFKNNNITDYNSKLTLFLPFVGFIEVATDLIGSVLRITCEIDIENGKGTYKLYSNDTLFEVKDVEPYYNIIFRTSDGVTFDNDSDSKYLYGLRPFVIYTWYEDQTTGNNKVDSLQTVSKLTGFNKCDTVTGLSTINKTFDEYNEILRILKDGFTL